MMIVRYSLLLTAALALVCHVGCAAYQMGNQVLFRNDLHTIHIPVFESESFRPFLGERLTEAVIREVETRTPYKVVPLARAESILSGSIESDRKRVVIESRNDDARSLQYGLVVNAQWVDRYGQTLMLNPSIRIEQQKEFVPEGGQSITTAQQKIINRIAREIVSQMELPW